MDRLPRTGEFYRDISDKTFQIVTIAVHTGTGEQMVVYQALFGDFGVYTQPVQQFTENFKNQKELDASKEPYRQKTPGAVRDQNTVGFLRNLQNAAGNYGNSQNTADQPLQPQNQADVSAAVQKDTGFAKSPADRSKDDGDARQPQQKTRPHTQSPAEARRILRQSQNRTDTAAGDSYYDEKRRRQMEEREQRREMFRKSQKHESATEELRANPCLLKFLEADTYEEKFHVLNTIQNDMTDRLIDDIAVVLDVVIPEGPLNDRFHQLRNIILTRQKYETNRFR